MAQVIVTFFRAGSAMSGQAQTYGREARSVELDSATQTNTGSVAALEGEHVTIRNNGTGLIWAQIGTSAAAAVPSSADRNMHCIGAGEALDFGPLKEHDIVSVVDDS